MQPANRHLGLTYRSSGPPSRMTGEGGPAPVDGVSAPDHIPPIERNDTVEPEQIVSTGPLDTQAAMRTLSELMARVRPTLFDGSPQENARGILHSLLGNAHSLVAVIADLNREEADVRALLELDRPVETVCNAPMHVGCKCVRPAHHAGECNCSFPGVTR